jgi:hypothetical protein
MPPNHAEVLQIIVLGDRAEARLPDPNRRHPTSLSCDLFVWTDTQRFG